VKSSSTLVIGNLLQKLCQQIQAKDLLTQPSLSGYFPVAGLLININAVEP